MKNFIPYGKQTINYSDLRNVSKALFSEYLTTGPNVKRFENKFRSFVKSKFAISCNNGTSALHLSLMSIDVKKDDVVILPIINFIASVNMAYNLGAKIFFADVDKMTGQMTPENLVNCIKKNKLKKVKAVITMYNSGSPNYAKEFYKLKKKYNFFLIEDACHSLGAKYSIKKNEIVGSCKYSDLTTFSFHPVKSITTCEGGMITTNNYKLFKKSLIIRNHGMVRNKNSNKKYNWSYKIVYPGYNYRLNDVSSALGISQLTKLKKFIKRRNFIFHTYQKKLKKLSFFMDLPKINSDLQSGNHLFVINLKKNNKINKNKLIQELYKKKIITQVHYIPIYKQPFYKEMSKGNYPGADLYFSSALSIPIFPNLKKKEINYICKTIFHILKKNISNYKIRLQKN